jgi:hypothetical protein
MVHACDKAVVEDVFGRSAGGHCLAGQSGGEFILSRLKRGRKPGQ